MTALFRMNYKKPSKVQATVLPLLLAEKPCNLICQSQTGTGKTAAFAIAMIHRINVDILHPQAICIAPTRELARQIITYTNAVAQLLPDIETVLAVPESVARGEKITGHIIVGTPGTILGMIQRKVIRTEHIKIVVMD